jgi:tetratricopeptide (TPR) repeat protein
MKVISPPNYYYQSSWQAYQRGEPAEALFLLLDGFDMDPSDRRIPQGFANMFGLMGLYEESKRYAAHSIRRLPYMWAADFEEMLRVAREDHAASPDNRFLTARLGIALLASGDVQAGMPYLEKYVSQFDDGVGPYIRVAGFVGLHRQKMGDAEGAAAVLDGIKSSYAQQVSAGINDNPLRIRRAFIALLEGGYEDALTALDDLSRGSGVDPEMAAALRLLTGLGDDGRFDKILSDQASRWDGQRRKMLARICGEDNWSEWDPLPGTCVSFKRGG